MHRQANIDGQNLKLLQQVQQALFRRDRQGDDQQVQARIARIFHELVDIAELGIAGDDRRDPVGAAIVEHPDDPNIRIGGRLEGLDEILGLRAAAHNDGASV